MKIDDILHNQKIPGRSQPASGPAGKGADFAAILQSRLQGPGGVDPAAANQLDAVAKTTPAQLRLEGLSLSEATINTLDSFSAALSNSTLATEELEPFVNALENDLTAMQALRGELPAEDPLSRLLDQVAAVSHLEAAKYRRGDYN